MSGPHADLFGRQPAVYTIPPERPFVDALADGIVAALGEEPRALVEAMVLLPTRRACRSLAEAFLRRRGGRPTLLPRLLPLGDVDEDEIAFGEGGAELGEGAGPADLPPVVPSLRRQLLLTRLILADPTRPATPDQAAALAQELARLIDQVQTERLGFERLAALVPDNYADHWRVTLDFLKIVTELWPAILAEEGALDPAERRNRLLEAQAKAWRARPPQTPVIAAGSTGSIPATADLLAVIAGLPKGAVVLPGLDRDMEDDAWKALGPTHPQFGMSRLLAHLGVERHAVAAWPGETGPAERTGRNTLINRALRPAAATASWRSEKPAEAAALEDVRLIECPGPQEEAGIIALLMRETLQIPGKTAALVTPDRGLARRVAGELRRWQVEVDDSAGRPLAQTPPGAFLRLSAQMVVEDLAPVPLLACLKHPLAALGLSPGACRALVRRLELRCLRGPRPDPGIDGLHLAVDKREPELRRLVEALGAAIAPLRRAIETKARLVDLVEIHAAAAEALAASDEESGAARVWDGDDGAAAATFMAELHEAASALEPLAGNAYPALLDSLLAGRVVRPRFGAHPRLFIWGLLEARLQRADLVVLGGLNEGTWPPETRVSPWMSRPMMQDFGLPLPERRIGLTAHDFVQGFAAPEVVLTRATRVEGTPTVPSRWLLRLETLVRDTGLAAQLRRDRDLLHWQGLLDAPAHPIVVGPPAPTPPVVTRPRKLSVTQIETWMRDPYAIYARHILGLKRLDPLDADPGAADYGTFIHRSLDRFVALFPGALPENAVDRLLAIGRDALGADMDRPGIRAFWWPRFERIADWFVAQERERRPLLKATASEIQGRLLLAGPGGPFELTAVADRIDTLADGRLVLIDYKTGAIPSDKEVAAGYAPQLPLEGAIAAAGGFAGLPKGRPADLAFWRLRGGSPAAECHSIKGDTATLIEEALAGLANLVETYDRETAPYPAQPRPDKAPPYGHYEHLARIKEWSTGGEDGS